MELLKTLGKYWPLTVLVSFLVGVVFFTALGVASLVYVGTLHVGQAPNATCPLCGHKCHIDYRKNEMSRFYVQHRCPECGQRSSEHMYLLMTPEDDE